MGWNEPEKGKDPWKGNEQPPDLDEALKRLHDKLKRVFLGGNKSNFSAPSNGGGGGFLIGVVSLVIFLLWAYLEFLLLIRQNKQSFYALVNTLKL